MSARPVLDTHAWIWWVDRDRRLGRAALTALDELSPDERPFVSDISLWEVATLVERGRLSLALPLADWLDAAAHPRSVTVVPISPALPPQWRHCRLRSTAIRPTASSSPPVACSAHRWPRAIG